MDIQRAKEEIKRAVQAYLATDDILSLIHI